MAATCSFEAAPLPVIDILIFLGAYSNMGSERKGPRQWQLPVLSPALTSTVHFYRKRGFNGKLIRMIFIDNSDRTVEDVLQLKVVITEF